MSTFPPSTFINTLETEANRILHASLQTANGFYYTKKFAVLPYLIQNNPGAVFLPELPYNKITNYWKIIKETPIVKGIPLTYEKDLVSQVMQILEPTYQDLSDSTQALQNEWIKKEKEIAVFLKQNFTQGLKSVTEIEVRTTAFGTKMSYDKVYANTQSKFTCYIRQDMCISNIIEAVIQGLLYSHPQTKNYPWEAHEAIADFLLESAKNQGIITDYAPTLNGIHSVDPDLLGKSHRYLQKLGLNFDNTLKKEGQLIYLNNKIISSQLTSIQHIILSLLIDKQNQIVSYDELADILWHDDEEFSVWAINKNMQRLRSKLSTLGAPDEIIKVVKGNGYSLQN